MTLGISLQERDIFDSPSGSLDVLKDVYGRRLHSAARDRLLCSRLGTVAMSITTILEIVWPERAAVRSLVGSKVH
jgi:hypothetical protein